MMKNYLELETVLETLVSQGLAVPAQVSHSHSFQAVCQGALILENGVLSYKPQRGDHLLTLTKASLMLITIQQNALVFKVRGSDGKEKQFRFVPLLFLQVEQRSFAGKVFGPESQPAQPSDASAIEDQVRYLKLLAKLYSRHLR